MDEYTRNLIDSFKKANASVDKVVKEDKRPDSKSEFDAIVAECPPEQAEKLKQWVEKYTDVIDATMPVDTPVLIEAFLQSATRAKKLNLEGDDRNRFMSDEAAALKGHIYKKIGMAVLREILTTPGACQMASSVKGDDSAIDFKVSVGLIFLRGKEIP